MSFTKYRSHHSASSRSGSTSSHDDLAMLTSDRFFEPEYPPGDISNWRSALHSPNYEDQSPGHTHFDPMSSYVPGPGVQMPFEVISGSLYPPTSHNGPQCAFNATHSVVQGRSLGKHPHPSVSIPTPSPLEEAPPAKRSRKDQTAPSGRVSGACTRCKRLKVTVSMCFTAFKV
ncbi:hypothetical protein BC629DRAFT_196438 [Irpex lacteus]|nr:hypothetical protein BC629DRAFT_196438 [Irpex lacteus]